MLPRTLLCLALPTLFASLAFAQTTPSLIVSPLVISASDFANSGTVTLTLTPVGRTFLAAGQGAHNIPDTKPDVAALLDLSSITSSNSGNPINFSAAGLALITLSGAPTGLAIDSGRLLAVTDTSFEGHGHRAAEIVLSYSGAAISSATTVTVNVDAQLIRGAGRESGGAGPALSRTFQIVNPTAANPLVSIAAGAGVTEGSPAQYTITANPAPTTALTVNLSVADAPGANFVAPGDEGSGKTVTVPVSGSATYTVPTVADIVDEPSGPVTVTLVNGSGYTVASVPAAVTVTDNDATPMTLSGPAGNVSEGGSKIVTLTLGRALARGEEIRVTITNAGTAAYSADYTLACAVTTGVRCTPRGPTFIMVFEGPSAASVAITISAVNDSVAETTPESVNLSVRISDSTGIDGTIPITDNLATFSIEDPGAVTVSPTALSLIEGNPAKSYTVVLGSDPGAAVAVTATPDDGAAQVRAGTTGAFGASATLNFTHGETGNWSTAQTVEVRATPNDGDTADESVTIAHASVVASNSNNRFHAAPIDPVSVAVTDADGLPVVRFAQTSFNAGEGDGTVTVTVSKTGNAAAEVGYATADNTATAPADYTATSGVLTWAAGDTADKTFTVPIVDDSAAEGVGGAESFRIGLSAPADSMPPTLLGSPGIAVVAILDNETTAELTVTGFGSTARVLEDRTVSFGATLSRNPSAVVAIPVRVKSSSAVGAGEVSLPASLSFGTTTATASVDVDILADHLPETDETLVVEVYDLPDGITLASGTDAEDSIVVEDVTNIRLAAPPAGAVTEGSTKTLTVELSENAPSGGVMVPVVLQGASTASAADVMLPTVAVAEGASTGTGTFTAVDDNLHEGAERAVLAVGAVNGYTTAQTGRPVNIADNDAAPASVTLSLAPATVSEGAGSTAVTVTATVGGATRWAEAQTVRVSVAGSGGASVVGFTAVADFDLTIPAGADSGTADFNLVPTDDATETNDETITVSGTLSGVTVSSADVTLADDDVAPDTTAPVLSTAAVNGTSLVLTYNEALDTTSTPAAAAFAVTVAGAARTVSSVAVSGSTVTLTLSSAVTSGQTVRVNYTVPDANPIQDAAGNDAAALSDRAVTNSTPDTTAPVLSTAAVNGTTLTLTYNEALNTTSTPAAAAFAVTVAGAARTVSSVAVSGSAVTLTLSSAVTHGQTVVLSYTVPNANPTQDAAGNDAAALTNQAVTNSTPDTTAPVLSTATVNGTSLVLTYDEPLDSTSTPATGAFDVRVDGGVVTRALSGVSVSGSSVTVTLSGTVRSGQAVTVSYTVPNANPIQDAAGNDAAALTNHGVTNNTAPDLNSATANGAFLSLGYNGTLDAESVPAASAFTVTVAGAARTVRSVFVAGSNVTLILSSGVTSGQVVTVSYAVPSANPIRDTGGNNAAALTNHGVTNQTPPVFSAAAVNGATLVLTYDGALDTSSVPAASAFTVTVGGTARTVSAVAVAGSAVTLTLSSAVTSGQAVTVSYAPPDTNQIRNPGGDPATAFTDQTVLTNSTAPVLSTATVNGATLVLTYDAALDTASVPAAGAFTVMVAGSARTVSAVAISGSAVTLTLSSAVTHGQTVTVSYAVPATNPIQDAGGNDAAALTNRAVTNNTPDTTAPVLSTATVNGTSLTLTYNEALDTSSTPAAAAFAVTVAGAARTVSSVAVSGSAVTLTLSSAVTLGPATVVLSYDGSQRQSDPGRGRQRRGG